MKNKILKTATILTVLFALIFIVSKYSTATEYKDAGAVSVHVKYSNGTDVPSGTVNLCGPNSYSASIVNGYADPQFVQNGTYCVEGISGDYTGTNTFSVINGHGSVTVVITKDGARCNNCTGN